MFDNYSINPNNEVNINAVNGTIVKNHKDSFFLRFHLKSNLSDALLYANPRMKYNEREYREVIILQMMLCGDMEVIAEVIWKESEE